MLLFITMPENSNQFLPSMKNLIEITKEDEKVTFNFSKINDLIAEKNVASVELYYNKHVTKISVENSSWTIDDKM